MSKTGNKIIKELNKRKETTIENILKILRDFTGKESLDILKEIYKVKRGVICIFCNVKDMNEDYAPCCSNECWIEEFN